MPQASRNGLGWAEKWPQNPISILLVNRLANRQSLPKSKNTKRFKYSEIEISNRSYIGSFGVPEIHAKKAHLRAPNSALAREAERTSGGGLLILLMAVPALRTLNRRMAKAECELTCSAYGSFPAILQDGLDGPRRLADLSCALNPDAEPQLHETKWLSPYTKIGATQPAGLASHQGPANSSTEITERTEMRREILIIFALFVSSLYACPDARGDVGVVLNESLNTGVARITGSGHSAVYLSRICPETPVKMRLCRPGEQGSVVSNYTTLGEDQPYEWNIVPLSIYLYGVADPNDRPLFVSAKIKDSLEDEYRKKILSPYCASSRCVTSENAEWREMVGAALTRSIYIFVVSTTLEQDRELIAQFNASPNENRFNAFSRNCANFTKNVINTYFPRAVRADYINDFGMASPKAIARSFAKYARRHPDSQYRVLHFAQVPGTIKRSSACRTGTEQLYRSKKLLVPMILFAGHELPIVAASYIFTGRFNPQSEYEEHPALLANEAALQRRAASSEGLDTEASESNSAEKLESAQTVGSSAEWKHYRKQFKSILDEAMRSEILPNRDYLDRVFKELDQDATPVADDEGNLWMEIDDGSKSFRMGLTAGTILGPGSDSQLAYQVILARVNSVLKSPARSRETILEFNESWNLLQQARTLTLASLAAQSKPVSDKLLPDHELIGRH
jgi:hypothetical protein